MWRTFEIYSSIAIRSYIRFNVIRNEVIAMIMKKSYTISYEGYIANKEYFDAGQIAFMISQQKKNKKLENELHISNARNRKLRYIIKGLNHKNKDLLAYNHNLMKQLKREDEGTHKIIKDFEKEIKDQQKIIDGELQKAYIDNAAIHEELEKLKKENERLKKENDKMNRIRKMDSNNSSMSPATDIFKKKKILNSRVKSNRNRGGQKGHKASYSKFEEPTKVIKKYVKEAPKAAKAIIDGKGKIEYYITQEISCKLATEIVETRYYVEGKYDSLAQSVMKQYAINGVSYTNEFKSWILYLNSKGTVPLHRLCKIINEMSDNHIHLAESTVSKWAKLFHQKSEGIRNDYLETLLKTKVVGVDETGSRVNGKSAYMHVLNSDTTAFFIVTQSRFDFERGPIHLLKNYKGCLVHDHFKPYYRIDSRHCECNVHILRYLRGGFEIEGSLECLNLISLLSSMNRAKKELIDSGIRCMKKEEIDSYYNRYQAILNEALKPYDEAIEAGKKKVYKDAPKYIILFRRMREYKVEHLNFINDFDVPFDNNLSERNCRAIKTKLKVSGQFYSVETANYYSSILSVIQTCMLRKENTLKTIEQILSN